ncbi:hypothetical protein Y032_0046g1394 [Ancylostoma ceylanicum]|nr:hypothetical protein Y032_0046g1394 [Ancylostoma ceylanicum]
MSTPIRRALAAIYSDKNGTDENERRALPVGQNNDHVLFPVRRRAPSSHYTNISAQTSAAGLGETHSGKNSVFNDQIPVRRTFSTPTPFPTKFYPKGYAKGIIRDARNNTDSAHSTQVPLHRTISAHAPFPGTRFSAQGRVEDIASDANNTMDTPHSTRVKRRTEEWVANVAREMVEGWFREVLREEQEAREEEEANADNNADPSWCPMKISQYGFNS